MLALALTGCGGSHRDDVLVASVIGDVPRVADPDRARLTPSSTVLIRATRQGLVAFDGNGQVEPALAESWTFTKDGLSAIFRLRRLRWANGGEVTGREVAASLNRAIASNSRNTLKPLLSSVETVIGMTDRVVEIRLKVPRPNLLELLAQPELAIRRGGSGTGPWVMVDAIPHGVRLRPVKDDDDPATDEIVMPPIREVLLRGERAGVAIARFMAARGGYVTGGTLGNWPVAQAAGLKSGVVRFDPAEGLFGLAVMRGSPALQDAALRNALSMAINREALVTGFGLAGSGAGRWRAIDRLLPTQMDSAQLPAAPAWSTASLVDRRIEARRLVAKAAAVPVLRVALPAGPGMTVLFARLAADWRAIGVSVVRVAANADADLRLIDEVAPNASANWYLTRTSCDAGLACDTGVDAALKASRAAPDLAGRAVQIATADAAAAAAAAYIPLATPVRWSLVDPALTGFHENSFAVHPLAELRLPRN